MFDRPRHRSVLAVLEALDADFLARGGFLFGGGTRIVLDLDEFRESDDVDFLSSSASGYAELRLAVGSRSHAVLFTQDGLSRLTFPREARVDQYGIRFPAVRGTDLKLGGPARAGDPGAGRPRPQRRKNASSSRLIRRSTFFSGTPGRRLRRTGAKLRTPLMPASARAS